MKTNNIHQHLSLLSDREIILALTKHRNQYSEHFLETAMHELRNRGHEIEDIKNNGIVVFPQSSPRPVSCSEACDIVGHSWDEGEIRIFINGLQEKLYIQRELKWFQINALLLNGQKDHFLESQKQVEEMVNRFIQLEEWTMDNEDQQKLENWIVLLDTKVNEFISVLRETLKNKQIPSAIKKSTCSSCVSSTSNVLLIPPDKEEPAREILKELENEREMLYQQVEKLQEENDVDLELKAYNRLIQLAPDDPMVFFNRGVIAFEMKKWKESADDFIRAALLSHQDREQILNCIAYLEEIHKFEKKDTELLHNLIHLIRQVDKSGDRITQLYRKLLEIDPADAVACLNLGYVLYEQNAPDKEVIQYLLRYLELDPETEDRLHVESIIESLKEG